MSKAGKLLERIDVVYQGKDQVGTLKGKITIPLIGKVFKDKLMRKDTKEIDPTLGNYDVEYDTTAMEKEIDKQMSKILEKMTGDKVDYIGGHALIGFVNSFWNPEYNKSR